MDTDDTESAERPNLLARIFGGLIELLFMVVVGGICVLVAWEQPMELPFPRFCVSTAGGIAIGSLAYWLVPHETIGWWLAAISVALGMAIGVCWERRS